MRTLICIISAVQLGAASTGCQGEAIDASVPVHLSLDARACGIDGPGRVLFSCGVAVSVWAIDAQSGDLIADRCIEIAEPGISLEDLPQVLEGADPLTDISVASVVVGLSLSPPSDGLRCAIGSADGSGQEPGRIYAVSAPVDVGRQGAAVALELTCNEALGQIPDARERPGALS